MPDRNEVPVPACTTLPVPVILPVKFRPASVRLNCNTPLSVMFPVMLPVAAALPSCRVPPLMVVPPE